MNSAIQFITTPFIEIYEDAMKETTLFRKILGLIILFWVSSLFLLFVVGWTTLVVNFILNPHMMDNVTWGIYDTLGS